MAEELDAEGFDPFEAILKAADQRLMLTATRSIFDEFQDFRKERRRERVLEMSGEHNLKEEETEEVDIEEATDDDFLAEAQADSGKEDDDEFLSWLRD